MIVGVCTDPKKIMTPKKKIQSSGRLCFLAGSNYNWKKLRPEKKGTVVWPSVGNWKKLRPEKRNSHLVVGNKKHNTHIIDTTTNKMSRATLPFSGFAPSLSMGGAVAPPNHGTAAPQCHAQAVTHWGCACCWRRNDKRHQIRETGGVPWP